MISFLINVFKLLRVIFVGVKNDQEFRILLFLLIVMLTGSTFFYSNIEGWRAVDAFYFSVMTMSTIGYGDLIPTTDSSKIFTVMFTFLSVGVFVSLNTKIVMMTLKQKKKALSKRLGKNKDKTQ